MDTGKLLMTMCRCTVTLVIDHDSARPLVTYKLLMGERNHDTDTMT